MAEAFGLVASVFATIQIADRVVSICKHYIENVRDAPSDLRSILVECSSVGAVLQNVEFLLKFEEPGSALRKALDGDAGPVAECHGAIEQLEKLIASDQNQAQGPPDSKRRKVQVTLRNLAWPLKETKARKLLHYVARCKNTISLALTATSSHDIKLIREETSRIQQALTENQRHDVYKWLRHTDPSSIHHRACRNHEPGTCEWMSRTPEWTQFSQGDVRCLWTHGIPGAGKTILASQLAKKIEENCRKSTSADSVSIGIYYYCYFGHNQDESAPFLRWVLERMCRKVDQVPDNLWKMFKDGRDPSLSDLLTALETASRYFSSVHITIDAIDESSPREELLKVLRDLTTDFRFSNIRLLVTSREYFDIEKVMEQISTPISMRNKYLDADIRLYTESRLATNDKLKDWTEDLRQKALDALSSGAKGMFRWVVCQLDALRRLNGNVEAIESELRNLPRDLNKTYDRIFDLIPGEDLQVVVSALDWICLNYKLFKNRSIDCNILLGAINEDLNRQDPGMHYYRYDIEFLREFCGCLITVTADKRSFSHRNRMSVVSFSHYTVMEHLATSTRFGAERCYRLDELTAIGVRASFIWSKAFQYKIGERRTFEGDQLSPNLTWQFDFEKYCIFAVIRMIELYEGDLLQNEELATMLTTQHHSRTHPLEAIRDLNVLRDGSNISSELLLDYDLLSAYNCMQIEFYEPAPPEICILVDLLYMHAFKLADLMLHKEGSARNLLGTTVHLGYQFGTQSFTQKFHLPLIDCIVAGISGFCNGDAMHHLLANWHEAIDVRCLLLYSTALHCHESFPDEFVAPVHCFEVCRLKNLLHLGAETDAPDFVVTPLQIAVGCLDEGGVECLLEGGADPNARGNPAGMNRPEHTILRACTHLSGMTPLEICQKEAHEPCLEAVCGFGPIFELVAEDRLKNIKGLSNRIKAMLLKYGAT